MEEKREEVRSKLPGEGYLQVYTGNGKGKTTAAIGLSVRAAGAGLKVFFGQFIKGMPYSELTALERFADLITVKQYGRGCFINRQPEQEDIDAAHHALEEIAAVIMSGRYDLVILDEANVAVAFNLISVDELLEIVNIKPDGLELVITGRYAKEEIIAAADLVTEMVEIKHYYQNGLQARKGIEK